MSHSFACSTPMIQAGTTAQPSPALVECQQPSRTHPVNATVLLHNPDNRFAASHTLYNSAPQLSAGSTLLCNQGNTTLPAPLVLAVTMPTQSVPSRISMLRPMPAKRRELAHCHRHLDRCSMHALSCCATSSTSHS